MPDPSQFNTDRTHPGRWTITFSNPPINMFVPETKRTPDDSQIPRLWREPTKTEAEIGGVVE